MVLPRRKFRDFFTGRSTEPIQVATLGHGASLMLSSTAQYLLMERTYAQKIIVKHLLTYEHLWIIQEAIDCGFCFEGTKANHLEFVLFDAGARGADYKLVIKSARWGQEAWFVTMHRTNVQQYRSMLRRQKLLRDATR